MLSSYYSTASTYNLTVKHRGNPLHAQATCYWRCVLCILQAITARIHNQPLLSFSHQLLREARERQAAAGSPWAPSPPAEPCPPPPAAVTATRDPPRPSPPGKSLQCYLGSTFDFCVLAVIDH